MSAFPNRLENQKNSFLHSLWLFFKPSWITMAIFAPILFLIFFNVNALWTLLSPSHLIITVIQRYAGGLSEFNYSNDFLFHGIAFYYILACIANLVWRRRKQGKPIRRILETILIFSFISMIMVSSFFLTTLTHTRTVILTDGPSCKSLHANSIWIESDKTCVIQNHIIIGRLDFVIIENGITLKIQNNAFLEIIGTVSNVGTLHNFGTITVEPNDNGIVLVNTAGLTSALGATMINDGIIKNNHFLAVYSDSVLINNGQINNHGKFFAENGIINNAGTISNYCDGELKLYSLKMNLPANECQKSK